MQLCRQRNGHKPQALRNLALQHVRALWNHEYTRQAWIKVKMELDGGQMWPKPTYTLLLQAFFGKKSQATFPTHLLHRIPNYVEKNLSHLPLGQGLWRVKEAPLLSHSSQIMVGSGVVSSSESISSPGQAVVHRFLH